MGKGTRTVNYALFIDPTPAGWAYGFPKALPAEAIEGTGTKLSVKTDFDLTKWVVEQGYPEESFHYFNMYVKEVDNYIYPGTDPQM